MIESIYEAAQLLGIGDNSTLIEINQKYKTLLFEWHPDHCKEDPEECNAMTERIVQAYKIVMSYCYNYSFSFKKEDLEKNKQLDPEEFWHKRFGHDALWGYKE